MSLSQNRARLIRPWRPRPDPVDPGAVLAMPLVLRIEKNEPPERQALLEAAARATVLACLDERAAGEGPWVEAFDDWCAGRIRKIARRARASHWAAVQDLDGVTVEQDGAAARALIPGPVGETDRRISRLQIGGTDVDGDLPDHPDAAAPLMLWVAPELPMTVGKLAAQVSHASMLGVRLFDEPQTAQWIAAGCPLTVAQAGSERWAQLLDLEGAGRAVAVRDAGYTEIAPGSCTVIAARR